MEGNWKRRPACSKKPRARDEKRDTECHQKPRDEHGFAGSGLPADDNVAPRPQHLTPQVGGVAVIRVHS